MTDAELNKRVARWCGWHQLGAYTWRCGDIERADPPNFATDLNACAKFEALLEGWPWQEYTESLWSGLSRSGKYSELWQRERQDSERLQDAIYFTFATAPPRARCEALVAMIGGADSQAHRPCVGGQVWDGDELLTCSRCKGAGCGVGASDAD